MKERLSKGTRFLLDFIYSYRYLIGILIVFFGVIFEINGSSIGCWEQLVPGGEKGRVLLGASRMIRSDEWTVSSSMLASQYHAGFPYFNELYRAAPTDMFIVYGQPVRDIAMIFRPFHWGYLFLPLAKGLSFYWVGKAVALALVSFELGMLITDRKRLLAFIYAVMICLSPTTQWWYAVNAFPDMLIYGQLAILLIYYYLKSENYGVRFMLGIVFAICGGAYALVFYPAWQIPFAYIFLMLAIWTIFNSKKSLDWKKDVPILMMSLILLIGGLSYVLLKSMDTIQAVTGTVYPGARCETGGGGLEYFLRYIGNIWFPIKETAGDGIVAPEWSVMLDLFPIGQILAAIVIFKEKKKDFLLILLEGVWLVFSVFVIFGVPSTVAKLSLLSNSTIARVFIAVGFINILLLVRALALLKNTFTVKSACITASVLACGMVFLSDNYVFESYLTIQMNVFLILLLGMMFYCLLRVGKKTMWLFTGLLLGTAFVSGGLVNPIRTGIYDVSASSLGRVVRLIDADQTGVWLDATGEGRMGDFLGADGVAVINPTNAYPALDRWGELDPTGEYGNIYNRYAHIEVELQDAQKTSFTLPVQDVIHIFLNTDDLAVLDVDYILTKSSFAPENTELITFELLYMDGGYSIYSVNVSVR